MIVMVKMMMMMMMEIKGAERGRERVKGKKVVKSEKLDERDEERRMEKG